ncbi:MAG TPA: membrane or secreted protein [Chitinophagaceae bacterium]
MKQLIPFILLPFTVLLSITGQAQKRKAAPAPVVNRSNPVYVDKSGVLRWTRNNNEAAFFGVNYTVPFAYGYRSHQALKADLEKAIDNDVYHFARLGVDAFRVHVWDTEITDTLGNLKVNEHLRLFDYLVARLKERKIKIFLTPLAFWGSGYPERDLHTGSFSSKWNKQQVLVTEAAIKAQETYLQQLLKHVNPFTKLSYGKDSDIVALEINNEPVHTGPREGAATYISRMVAAVKGSGWTKPVFYNISESPSYAGVVAAAPIDGVSFQWYPTGLVANRSQRGNYLPNIDNYRIPFGDSLAAYRNKARMVYEFDAGDVVQSYLYPAMARSFRTAGFQWATQFAYDPLATAYGNTEYQTHYLNLAYTPSKAISLLIAGKVFRTVPRGKSYGAFPADTVFETFRVSYRNDLSEMNSGQEFYYSNTTTTRPLNPARLLHVAGVGSSPLVSYGGRGAYFLDRIEEGVWRLEVMPDAVHIRDPFERASPRKEVTRIHWQTHRMQIALPQLGTDFSVSALNEGNTYKATANNGAFLIQPGTYLVRTRDKESRLLARPTAVGVLKLTEFVAPRPTQTEPFVAHEPSSEVSPGRAFTIRATMVGVDSADNFSVELRHSANLWKTVPLRRVSPYEYEAVVPADMATPGAINYRMIIQKRNGAFFVFPGGHRGDPYAWDAFVNESWQTFVVTKHTPLVLFNPTTDRQDLTLYNPDWRTNTVSYLTAGQPNQLVQRIAMSNPGAGQVMGWHHYVGDKLQSRPVDTAAFDRLVVRARSSTGDTMSVRVALITKDAQAFAATILLDSVLRPVEIPLALLVPDSMLLLPRPYPGFLPLWFQPAAATAFRLSEVEKLEILFRAAEATRPREIVVESVQLQGR